MTDCHRDLRRIGISRWLYCICGEVEDTNHYLFECERFNNGVVGWCDGAGQTSSAGASYNLDYSRARAYCACSRCGWGVVWTFLLSSILSLLSPSLWETARYRLKYCLKGPLNPKQPTKFNNLRQELFDKVSHICQPTIDVFLNGSHELTYQENKQIFLAVQDFIVKSKRFQIT